MQERPNADTRGWIGLVLGGVLYAGAWVAVFGAGSPVTFYVWISLGGLALGGFAGFSLHRNGLISPLSIALLLLLAGLVPTGGIEGASSSPGALSMAFIFGWPVFFVLAAVLAYVERSGRNWLQTPS